MIGVAAVLTAPVSTGLMFATVAGTVVMCTCGVLLGLTCLEIEKKSRPNQGIWMSLRNAALSTSLAAIVSGFPVVAVTSLALNPWAGISACVGMACYTGIGSGLFFGGSTFIGHFIMRMLLWIEGGAPLNYVAFLDYACDRVFLQKVGGGYIFVHRLLLEYFASLRPK